MSPAGRHHHRPSFVLLIVHVCLLQRAAFTVVFPTESDDTSVHFRSLRDILFRPPNGDTSPVIASFRPALPSPTLASPSVVPNQIRFLESDAIGEPPIFTSIHSEFKSVVEGRRSTSDSSANPTVVQDRWPWPYSSLGQAKSLHSVHPDSRSNHPNIIEKGLIVKKSVAKPYRVQSKSSSCPKLLHDLTITCSLPANHRLINQQVAFQWYKTQHKTSANSATSQLSDPVKIPIAFGSQIIYKDTRFGVNVIADQDSTSVLTIRQLKPQDCGSYVCEALDAHNATVLHSSEFLIFLCY